MHLRHLSLSNFRNYTRLELDLPPGPILLEGGNAQGKTNFLEAIYYLATSRSPHASADRQLIHWLADAEMPFARAAAEVQKGDTLQRVEIILVKEERPGQANPSLRKRIKINGVPKRALDLLGQINVVLFLPRDIALVTGSPEERRRHMNITLCQTDSLYCRTLTQYNRVLTQRNHLLRLLRERQGDPEQLHFWDDKLTEFGALIMARRQALISELAVLAHTIHLELTAGREHLQILYRPSLQWPLPSTQSPPAGETPPSQPPPTEESLPSQPPPCGGRSTVLLPVGGEIEGGTLAELQAEFLRRLRANREEEIIRGMTLIGPHRDDLRFFVGGVDLHIYGSRGQQRTAVLALKLAEVQYMAQVTGEQPILLLDEVMAELDEVRRRCLMGYVNGAHQAILTTTDSRDFDADFLARAAHYRVQEGRIRPAK